MKMVTVICFFLLALFHLSQVDSGRVSIAQNGYSYIQVGISPDVPYDPQIIPNLQAIITKASRVLYRATNNRAYFKDVRFLIPENWNIQAGASTWELYDQADVKVAPPSSSNGDTPYTVQSGGCGAPGEYIHYTTEYLITSTQADNIATYGIPENIFVHEWAHLRYGVFDEHGYPGDENYPVFQTVFYYPLPNVCTPCEDFPEWFEMKDNTTLGDCNIDPDTLAPDDNCIFEITSSPSSSLMSLVNEGSVVEFCNDVTHVQFNPNKHNDMCETQSTWTVISRHPDFSNNNNPPSNINNLEPSFSIFKSRSSRFVLVMDISSSMDLHNRFTRMYESAFRWIMYDIPDNSSLGLVQFSTSAGTLTTLINIKTPSDRSYLASKLPGKTAGNTCIGCGLKTALEVLRDSGPGGNIILMTDGEENVKPYINDVMNDILMAKVQVSTIAYGREAESKLENVAMDTGGKSYFVDDDDYFAGLSDALTGSTTGFSQAVPTFDVQVKHFQDQYASLSSKSARKIILNEFIVDQAVGRNLVLRIDYQTKSTLQRIEIKSPSGVVYYNSNFIWDDSAKCVLFKQDFAEFGKWTFTLTVTSSDKDALLVKVTSQTRDSANTPITVQCSFPDDAAVADARITPVRIVAKVLKGATPVKGAKVKAYVLLPDKLTTQIELLDNGAFADATKGDGIYSRYFTRANATARYSVTCEAWDDGYAYYEVNSTKVLTGNFRRMESGGSIRTEKNFTVESYPPERIRDLVVYDVTTDEHVFPIKFTAPGERLDQGGRVPKYKIKVSTDYKELSEANFDQQSPNSISINVPLDGTIASSVDPGMTEYLSLVVEQAERNKTYFIAMKSYDTAGSPSKVSNLASFRFRPPICPNGETWAPCTCIGGNITCSGISVSKINEIFNKVSPVDFGLNVDLRPTEPDNIITIPDNILGVGKIARAVIVRCPSTASKLAISRNAFFTSRDNTTQMTISNCDLSTLDLAFLTGFNVLKSLELFSNTNIQFPFKTLPNLFPNLIDLNFYASRGLNDAVDFPPSLSQGLVQVNLGSCALDDIGAGKMLDWLVSSSSKTLTKLLMKTNYVTNIPTQIPLLTALNHFELPFNRLTIIRTGELRFTSPVSVVIMTANKVATIQPGAFQGNFANAAVAVELNSLTRFESSTFEPVLQQMAAFDSTGLLYINGNPVDCGTDPCHMAWIERDNRNYLERMVEAKCSNGTLFNDLNVDVYQNCVSTTASPTPPRPTQPGGSEVYCPPGNPDALLPIDPNSCDQNYYYCVNDYPYYGNCPDGSLFDPNALVCVPDYQCGQAA